MGIVFLGVVIVILQSSDPALNADANLELTNVALLTIFIIEVGTRWIVVTHATQFCEHFFFNPYNVLDFGATTVDFVITIIGSLSNHYGTIGRLGRLGRLLRFLRLLRLTRLLRLARVARHVTIPNKPSI